ncbi:MAG: hypothetical protein LAT62_15675 [Natronospirillum sp.]|uniref:hypothetical protein n=1 Tax=Natronospirillum sp. TaxID=2812955 RepID=UPI00260000CA|nr:hypothetical protein [Natronospirillum sp.]MCH8553377.1 hypothetical protein [Natronospirillum sp.]
MQLHTSAFSALITCLGLTLVAPAFSDDGRGSQVVQRGGFSIAACGGDRLFHDRFEIAGQLPDPTQFPAYQQLRRDVLINADLWDSELKILSAGFGFEGIQGVPGLTGANLQAAIDAGAGVNLDWAQLNPMPPLRNITSAGSVLGIAFAGFGSYVCLADAMPIVFSWPVLPSSVSPEAVAITLNTGEVVTPVAAALNPNYDYNERHVIVVFGEFGNRIPPGQPGSVHPVQVDIVAAKIEPKAVGPEGPVSMVGLSSPSSNPYEAGPALVGAKLTRFSPVGDFPPPALANSFPNDAYSHFGEDAQYRLRLFTSGGFSPDGVSGLLPDDFPRFFRLHALDAEGEPVLIDEEGVTYDLGDGSLTVLGLAEVGEPVDEPADRAYYVEDHDNYFDIVLKGDETAMVRLTHVEIPTSAVPGYFDIYNPGGPGRTPDPDTIYTEPSAAQMQVIDLSLDDLRTVSFAEQDLDAYDLDDDMPVVFRLRSADGPDRFTSSSITARLWIDQEGLDYAGIDFPNEMLRPAVSEVRVFVRTDGSDRIYTLDAAEQAALSGPDSGWADGGPAFGAFATEQLGSVPVYRFFDPATERHLFTPDLSDGAAMNLIGVAWFAARLRPGH